ncbi:MAG: hypothetical protein ACP5M0_14250 [Desulfomonilaceae bacterium]
MGKTVKAFMLIFCTGMLVAPVAALAESGAQQPSLAAFDEDVAVARRLIRQYCAIVQEMLPAASIDAEKQKQALQFLKEGMEKWAAVQKKYSENPPAEYAKDPQFKARLQDMTNALQDMLKALETGQIRRSLLACGFGCGLCVTMHEENGLNYGLDKLFHLRKTAKTALALMKTGHWEQLKSIMPQFLKQRDAVFLAPLPWPQGDKRNDQYVEAVKNLSHTCDDLALAITLNDRKKAGELLKGIVPVINKPYGLAL